MKCLFNLNSIKSNKILAEKYIKYLKSIRSKFDGDIIILNKINNILDILLSLNFYKNLNILAESANFVIKRNMVIGYNNHSEYK